MFNFVGLGIDASRKAREKMDSYVASLVSEASWAEAADRVTRAHHPADESAPASPSTSTRSSYAPSSYASEAGSEDTEDKSCDEVSEVGGEEAGCFVKVDLNRPDNVNCEDEGVRSDVDSEDDSDMWAWVKLSQDPFLTV